jgi:hypothetical protein
LLYRLPLNSRPPKPPLSRGGLEGLSKSDREQARAQRGLESRPYRRKEIRKYLLFCFMRLVRTSAQ